MQKIDKNTKVIKITPILLTNRTPNKMQETNTANRVNEKNLILKGRETRYHPVITCIASIAPKIDIAAATVEAK